MEKNFRQNWSAVSFGRRLRLESVPRRCQLRNESHRRHLPVFVSQRLQRSGLHGRHRRMRSRLAVRTRRTVRQHSRIVQVQLHARIHRTSLRDQHQRMRLESVPKRRHLSGRARRFPMRLHARYAFGLSHLHTHLHTAPRFHSNLYSIKPSV